MVILTSTGYLLNITLQNSWGSHFYRNTPPISVAILWGNLGAWGHWDAPHPGHQQIGMWRQQHMQVFISPPLLLGDGCWHVLVAKHRPAEFSVDLLRHLSKASTRQWYSLYIYIYIHMPKTSSGGQIFWLQDIEKQRERRETKAEKGRQEKEEQTRWKPPPFWWGFFLAILKYKTGDNWDFRPKTTHQLRSPPYICPSGYGYIYIYIYIFESLGGMHFACLGVKQRDTPPLNNGTRLVSHDKYSGFVLLLVFQFVTLGRLRDYQSWCTLRN